MRLAAFQCDKVGLAVNEASLFTAYAISGHVAMATYIKEPIRDT